MKFGDVVLSLGYLASVLVFATFFMRSRVRLRQVGIASNVVFVGYALVGHIIPVLVLHAFLLPLNCWRLWELHQSRKKLDAAMNGEIKAEWFELFAHSVELGSGTQLFAKGDLGDRMYLIVSGTVRLSDSAIDLGPGTLLGEIAIFSPNGTRTEGAVAGTDVRLLAMSREDLLALYRQHPDFGVYLLHLVTGRLLENNRRLVDAARSVAAAGA